MIGFYDIETGGIDTAVCQFGCGCILTLPGRTITVYGPESVRDMVRDLRRLSHRIGYNCVNFDDVVLARFGFNPGSTFAGTAVWDVYRAIRSSGATGSGWTQGDIAEAMLGLKKGDSSEIPDLLRRGKIGMVINHCIQDVQALYRICLSAYCSRGRISTTGNRCVSIQTPAVIGRYLVRPN